MRGRPSASVPARCVGSTPIVARMVLPAEISSWMSASSFCVMLTTGMVIEGSLPVIWGAAPATLFPMITATAPAACARAAFCANVHVPRSISAIFPESWAAFTSVSQPSVVGNVVSWTSTTSADKDGCGMGPPKSAVPNCFSPAMPEGESIRTIAAGPRKRGAAFFTYVPSHTRFPVLVEEAARWALVIWSQRSPKLRSKRLRAKMSGRLLANWPLDAFVNVWNPSPWPISWSTTVSRSTFVPSA